MLQNVFEVLRTSVNVFTDGFLTTNGTLEHILLVEAILLERFLVEALLEEYRLNWVRVVADLQVSNCVSEHA